MAPSPYRRRECFYCGMTIPVESRSFCPSCGAPHALDRDEEITEWIEVTRVGSQYREYIPGLMRGRPHLPF